MTTLLVTSQSHSPLAEPKPTRRALGPWPKPPPGTPSSAMRARAKFRKKSRLRKFQTFLGRRLCGHKVVDKQLRTQSCGHKGCGQKGCGHKVVDKTLWTQSCGQKVVDTTLRNKKLRTNLRTKLRTNTWTHADTCGQTCGHTRTKLRTRADKVADKLADTRGQSCGHARTKLWTHAEKLRTKLWTHADKLVDACGQSCGHRRTKWRTLWFRTVRFGCQTLGLFGVSLNFGSKV